MFNGDEDAWYRMWESHANRAIEIIIKSINSRSHTRYVHMYIYKFTLVRLYTLCMPKKRKDCGKTLDKIAPFTVTHFCKIT